MRKTIFVSFGLLILLGVNSCSEAIFKNSLLYIHPRWDDFDLPKEVRSFLYVIDIEESRQRDVDAVFYSISIDPGVYRLLAYNTDAERIVFTDLNDFYQAKATVKPIIDKNAEVKRAYSVENAFRFSVESIILPEGEPVHLSPQVFSMVKTLTLKFETFNGEKYKKIYGTLMGVYYSVYLSTGLLADKDPEWGVPFEVALLEDGAGSVSINVLGIHNPDYGNSYQNVLDIIVEDVNGESNLVQIDLDEVISDMLNDNDGSLPADTPVQIPIVLQTIDNGLKAEVKPWEKGKGIGHIY